MNKEKRENYCKNCDAWCCYDGVYLSEADESVIREVVENNRDFFDFLPLEYIVNSEWEGLISGRKTNTKPKQYSKDFPLHFTHTTCVFLENNICKLEEFAIKRGEDSWRYKPKTCCLFPLQKKGDEYVEPQLTEDDCNIGEYYPGFVSFLPCYKFNKEDFFKEKEYIKRKDKKE